MESRAAGQESLISTALIIHKVQDMDLRKSLQPLVIHHKKAQKRSSYLYQDCFFYGYKACQKIVCNLSDCSDYLKLEIKLFKFPIFSQTNAALFCSNSLLSFFLTQPKAPQLREQEQGGGKAIYYKNL